MPNPRYAANTEVPADRTRAEIERTLQRYGAAQFFYGWDANRAVIGFTLAHRQIRFLLPMPDRNSEEFTLTDRGRSRSDTAAQAAWEQATRSRWRALGLVIKAKLEAVEAQITTVEDEFLAHIVLPDGSTVGNQVRPKIADAYHRGLMPPSLLPMLGDGK